MSRFRGKIGFIHRRLWREDWLYRACFLLGPAPLVGGLITVICWHAFSITSSYMDFLLHEVGLKPLQHQTSPPWALAPTSNDWAAGEINPVQPMSPLPAVRPNGSPLGYVSGWLVTINSIVVSTNFEVNVTPAALSSFVLEGPQVDMRRLAAQNAKADLYVGAGQAFLAVKTAGVYAISARVDRPVAEAGYCLTRLGFGGKRIVSNIEIVGNGNALAKVYDGVQFRLEPGLYPIEWVFGCWQAQQKKVAADGTMAVLIRHPGEQVPLSARADEIVRREQARQ